eukprot:CAMPEP_0117495816 /NCGR_PEP_ID=MMETSP0784-20121206/20331_1 /TAXON_ID=39447 /ORGANISM="" /LENGTH=204 /DNA_ID=CAMNT_0005290757 /DNA_START=65 /DNA_END=679 /DNA_ORIENTATION=+
MAGDPVASDGAIAGDVTIGDEVVDRLVDSLGRLEADYARTIAADRRLASEQETSGAAPLDDDALVEPPQGYAMLGSDDEGGESDEDAEVQTSDGVSTSAATGAATVGQTTSDEVFTAVTTGAEPEFDDFKAAVPSEDFADFTAANLAAPPPPLAPTALAAPLSQEDQKLIRETMQQIHIEPPLWASRLSDKELHRMVKAITKSL